MSSSETPIEPQHNYEHGSTLTRRQAMKRVGATAAAFGLAGAGTVSVSSEPARAVTLIGAGWGASGLTEYLWGSDADEDEIEEAEANELHDEIYAYALEREVEDENAMASLATNIDLLAQDLRRNVAFTIADRTQAGDDKDDVIDAAKDKVGETVKDYQENHIQRWERQVTQVGNRVLMFAKEAHNMDEDNYTLDDANDFENDFLISITYDRSEPSYGHTRTLEFLDFGGEDYFKEFTYVTGDQFLTPSVEQEQFKDETSRPIMPVRGTAGDYDDDEKVELAIRERDGSDTATVLDVTQYHDNWVALEQLYEDETDYAETLVDLLYQPIKDGEADAHDVASGSMIRDFDDLENYQEAASPFRAIGMPEATDSVVIQYEGVELEGLLFWTQPDDDGLEVGEEIDPSDTIGEFHGGFELRDVNPDNGDDNGDEIDEDDGPYSIQLTEPFEIVGIHDSDDETLHFDTVTHIEPDDEEDHEEILDALIEAFEQREETREERQEIILETDGFWGGVSNPFEGGGISNRMLAGLAGAVAFVWALGNLGD